MLALNYGCLEAGNVDDSMGPVSSVSPGKSTEKELPDEVQDEPNGTLTGVVARYARHRDYHHILRPRLKELAAWLDAAGGPGTRSLWYVDTGPVLERDLGQRAGIGFVGKHTNLISRQLGNWFLLSEILTTATLEPDEPGRNHCGSCTRCLSACPTDALPAPFTLDARRCISYLTIEHRGDIPEPLRPAIGNRIFGCDDCLAVCPWNRFARESALMRESRRAAFDSPDLISWLELDEAQFFALFAGTPIYRTKRNGLRRNICVALGNSGDMRALPALSRAAQDPDEMVARHARWAMAQIETSN
jgi:epoxyqueuosine reductase